MALPEPKAGEYWVVEDVEDGSRGVARCDIAPGGTRSWLIAGNECCVDAVQYRPIRRVKLED